MTNHVHLLVTPRRMMSASRLMQTVGRLYVHYFNTRYRRTGALWESRFHSALVESRRYFLRCCRYIELNPVRAAMVSSPAEYEWSSFAHLALGNPDPLLVPHVEILALGATRAEQERAYHAMCAPEASRHSAAFIRHSTQRGAMIGTAAARAALAAQLGRPVARPARGGARPGAGRPGRTCAAVPDGGHPAARVVAEGDGSGDDRSGSTAPNQRL